MKYFTRLFLSSRISLARYGRRLLENHGPINRLALWLLAKKQKDVYQFGEFLIHVEPRDFGVTLEIACTGSYEKTTMSLVMSLLRPGDTFVDIGAHVGLYSLTASRTVRPSGKVFAFEPDTENFKLLERNVRENACDNVQCIPKAVAHITGSLPFFPSPYNTGDHQLFYAGSARKPVTVDCTTLDTFFQNYEGKISVIKMDIQGAEDMALQGMRTLMTSHPEMRLIMEFSPYLLQDAGVEPLTLLHRLEKAGYSFSIIDNAQGSIIPADTETILTACPEESYTDILCEQRV